MCCFRHSAPSLVAEVINRAVKAGVLEDTFFETLPTEVTHEFLRDGPAIMARTLYRVYSQDPEHDMDTVRCWCTVVLSTMHVCTHATPTNRHKPCCAMARQLWHR